MCNNAAVANLIREGKTQQIYGVMETQARVGMYTMDFNLKDLYLRGLVEREEARRRMRNPQLLDI
jgi:twitching motility protein PilT